jgi:predicted transcriptional regulator
MRSRSFLDSSPRLAGIIDIVKLTKNKPISFTYLRDHSEIKYKQSLLKYLKFCIEKKLIASRDGMEWKKLTGWGHKYDKRVYTINYLITAKGKKFLEFVA